MFYRPGIDVERVRNAVRALDRLDDAGLPEPTERALETTRNLLEDYLPPKTPKARRPGHLYVVREDSTDAN